MAQAVVLVALATALMRRNTLRHHPSTVTSNACHGESAGGDPRARRSRLRIHWTHRRRPGRNNFQGHGRVGAVGHVSARTLFKPAAVGGVFRRDHSYR